MDLMVRNIFETSSGKKGIRPGIYRDEEGQRCIL